MENSIISKYKVLSKTFLYWKEKLSILSEFDSESEVRLQRQFLVQTNNILWAFSSLMEKDYLKYLEISMINTQSLKMHISIDKFHREIYSRNTSESVIHSEAGGEVGDVMLDLQRDHNWQFCFFSLAEDPTSATINADLFQCYNVLARSSWGF